MNASARLRVLFFGTPCAFSALVLERLLEAPIKLAGLVMPGVRTGPPIVRLGPRPGASIIPIANPRLARTLPEIAGERDAPAFALGQPRAPEALATLAALTPDIACVACFPQRVPGALRRIPAHGFLNVHPALLPAHRGPAPLFWSFHAGESRTGVTVHRMDSGFDTGPIVGQRLIDLPEGVLGEDADLACAQLGAELLIDVLHALAAGSLDAQPQPAGGSYEPWPSDQDFELDARWPAQRAFIFMRGTSDWERPYVFRSGGTTVLLDQALGYSAHARIGVPVERSGDIALIQFSPGVLRARLAV
jgi:methionyl-tRNA formyltransferase